jgi:hypothetical protein
MGWAAWQQIPGGTFAGLTPMTPAAGPFVWRPADASNQHPQDGALATTVFAVGEDGLVVSSTGQPAFDPNPTLYPQSQWDVVLPGQKFSPETPIIAVGDAFYNGSIDLFGVGPDGGVYTAWNHTGVWQGWDGPICPGGRFSQRTPVAAVSMRSGWIDLFAVGLDGAIWTAWYHDNPPWQGWGRIGGDFPQGTPVSAVSMRNGWIDLYVIGGADNAVYTWWYHDDPPWLTGRVGGKFAPGTPVTAVTDNKGWIDLFAVGLDGSVWTAWYHDAPWQGWGPVLAGGKFSQGTPVAAVSPNSGWIDLFAVGLDGDVWTAWYHDAPWQGWGRVVVPGDPLASRATKFLQKARIATVANTRNVILLSIFAIAEDGHAYYSTYM